VDAFDAAGNRSARSNPASATLPGDPVIAAAGDIACDPSDASFNGGNGTSTACHEKATGAVLGSIQGLTAVLALGDLQYQDAAPLAKWQASYDPAWGRFKTITYPQIGNHEYYSGVATSYFSYWGAVAGSPSQGWYSFNLGSWHIV